MAIKKGYKQTDIGVFPEDWKVISLRDCLHLLTDFDANGSFAAMAENVETLDGDGYAWYVRATDLEQNLSLSKVRYTTKSSYNFLTKTKLYGNEVLVAKRGEIGKVYYFQMRTERATLAPNLYLLKLNEKIDSLFLYYYLLSNKGNKSLREINASTSLGALYKEDVKSIVIPLPSPKEQSNIANTLKAIDRSIDRLTKNIEKKRLIKQGVMHDLLTSQKRLEGFIKEWDNIIIGDLGYSYTGLSGKDKSDFENGNAEYITFLNVMNNSVIDLTALERVFIASNDSQNKVNKGDLLFNTSSETPEEVGMCSLFDSDRSNLYLNSFCFGFRITNREQADGLFLSYYFRGEPGRKIMGVLAQGATRYNLSKQNFLKTSVLLPELDEQKAIANILYDIDVEIGLLETKKLKYENLRQAVMEQLLTGQIRLVGKTTKQKTVTAKKEQKKATKHSSEFEEATVITFLVDKFATTQYPLSRFRYTKYSYLLHRRHQRVADGFGKYAAGPYKPTNRYKGPENIAIKNNYISKVPNPKSGNDAFLPSENKDAGIQYFNKYYGDEIGQWIEQFRYYKGDYLEVLTTIDMAMNDLEETSKQITVASLREYIASIPEWRKKLEYDYFSDESIEKAMAESRSLFG